jgi:hypothetical protein
MRIAGARASDHQNRLTSFQGAVVTSVMAWQHGVSLGFNDEPRSINVEGPAHVRAGGRTEHYAAESVPGSVASVALAKRLLDLIGRRVDRIAVSEDGALVIAFGQDFVLTVPADDSDCEAYVISFPDEFILAG